MKEKLNARQQAMIAAEKAMIRDMARGRFQRDFITPAGPPTGKNPILERLDALYGGNEAEKNETEEKQTEKK